MEDENRDKFFVVVPLGRRRLPGGELSVVVGCFYRATVFLRSPRISCTG